MAYNPSLYNPYGSQQFQPTISYPNQYMSSPAPPSQQPINGLIWIDGIEGAQMFPLPPNSTSPPLMFRNEPRFAVKTTDQGYGSMARQGYNSSMGHDDIIEKLGEEFRTMDPNEKMMMKNKVISMFGNM